MAAQFGAEIKLTDNFTPAIDKAVGEVNKFKGSTDSATGSASAFQSIGDRLSGTFKKLVGAAAAAFSIEKLKEGIEGLAKAVMEDQENENRFVTLMGNVHGMTSQGITSVSKLASSIGSYGVVSKDATLAGAGQLATFQLSSKSIMTLLPALDDLVVSQKGVNGTENDAIGLANLVGKAMTGNAGALSRYGVTLTDTQKKLIKNGTEQQRASAVAQALEANYGRLNKTTAATAAGGMARMRNSIEESKEEIGEKMLPVIAKITNAFANALPKIMPVIEKISMGLISFATTALPSILSAIQNVSSFIQSHSAQIESVLDGVGNVVKNIAGFFVNNWGAILPVLAAVTGAVLAYKAAMAISNVISGISNVMNTILVAKFFGLSAAQTALAGATGNTTIAQKLLNAAQAASPTGLIIAGIAALVIAFVVLWNTCKPFREFWIGLWNGIKTVTMSAVNAIKGFFANIPAFFSGIGSKIRTTATAGFNAVKGFFMGIPAFFSSIGNKIKMAFTTGLNGIKSFFTSSIPALINSIGRWFKKLPYNIGFALGSAVKAVMNFGKSIKSWVTGTLPGIITGIVSWFAKLPSRIWTFLVQTVTKIGTWGHNLATSAGQAAQNAVTAVGKWFQQLPSRVWTFLTQVVAKIGAWGSNMATSAGQAAQNTITAVAQWFQQLPSRVWTFLTQVVSNVGSWGSSMMSKAGEAARNTIQSIVAAFQSLPQAMMNIGKNLITGLWNGITGAFGWLKDKIGGFCGNIVKGFKAGLGIHSPSTVMQEQVGKFMALGIGQGFIDNMRSVTASMTEAIPTHFNTKTTIGLSNANAFVPMAAPVKKTALQKNGENKKEYKIDININNAVVRDKKDLDDIAHRFVAEIQKAFDAGMVPA